MRKYLVFVATLGMLVAVPSTVAGAVASDSDSLTNFSDQQVAEYKEAQDAAGLGPGIVGPRDPVEMAEEALLVEQKDAAVAAGTLEWFTLGPGSYAPLATIPASKYLPNYHSTQSKSYWCGPAAVAVALRSSGYTSPNQTTLANQLKTTTDGTAWSGVYVNTSPSTGRPVKDVLNNRIGFNHYVTVDLAYSPPNASKRLYKQRLTGSINSGWAMVGAAWEVPNGPRLIGHPPNIQIWHYVTMRGYSSSGSVTRYADPAHGSTVSWAGNVPKYPDISSNLLTTIFGGRGYVW